MKEKNECFFLSLSFSFLPLLRGRGRVPRLHVFGRDVVVFVMIEARRHRRSSSSSSASAARPGDEEDQKDDKADSAEAEQQPLPPRRGALLPSSQASSAVARAVRSRKLEGAAAAAEAVACGSSPAAEHDCEWGFDQMRAHGLLEK